VVRQDQLSVWNHPDQRLHHLRILSNRAIIAQIKAGQARLATQALLFACQIIGQVEAR
jgi:hypothetical protein